MGVIFPEKDIRCEQLFQLGSYIWFLYFLFSGCLQMKYLPTDLFAPVLFLCVMEQLYVLKRILCGKC